MAVGKRGILGGMSGRIANVVGTSWKGRAVFKSLPLSVANPRTTPQVNQRNKFSAISHLGSLILSSVIKPLMDRFSGDISGYNYFCKLNKGNSSNAGVWDADTLIISKGKMEPVLDALITADVSSGQVSLDATIPVDATWGQNNESLYVLVLNETKQEVLGSVVEVVNPSEEWNGALSGLVFEVGDRIVALFAIKRADGTQVSDSVSVATLAVA